MPGRTYALVAAGALGILIGIQAFRSLTAQIVLNLAEDAPTTTLGLVALGTWAPGFAGWLAARAIGGASPAWRLGLVLAAIAALRQTAWGEDLTAILAIAAWVVWLWWLPALLYELSRRATASLAASAVVLGIAAEAAAHSLLQGLEIHAVPGPGGALLGIALSLALAATLALGLRAPVMLRNAGATWGGVAIGPYLFLQLSLLLNVGRLETVAAWPPLAVAASVSLALVVAVAALRLPVTRLVAVAASLVALASLILLPLLPTAAPLLVIPAQAALALLVAGAVSSPGVPSLGRAYRGFAAGAGMLFVLAFVFYRGEPIVVLWPVATLVVGAVALRAPSPEARPAVAAVAASSAVLALAAIGATALPSPSSGQIAAAPRAPGELRILDHNIHQGIDRFGLPDLPAIAAIIEGADADLVGLQEVNRGWDIAGGVDALAYLRWRFPQYHIVYGPMHAEHFGNVVMSRFPIVDQGWARFPTGPSGLPRGYTWARVSTPAGEVVFAATHLTAYDRGDERTERASQAQALVAFWGLRPRMVLVGDLNDAPGSPAVTTLTGAGMRDILAAHGIGGDPTYVFSGSPFTPGYTEKLDYIFTSPDVTTVDARIIDTAASDHLPLSAIVRLR